MARQYFNSTIADSLIVESSVTPTTTKTSIFTPFTLANQAFPVGYGLAAPFAGQVYKFACGGLITTPATGTLTIDPYYGPGTSTTVFGTDMGASPATTVTASLSNIQWELSGRLIFRTISSAATSSTAWLTGTFRTQGTASAGTGWIIPFGSTAAVSVDTTGTGSAGTFGAIMFAITYSVTGGTIKTEWTEMLTRN